MQESTRKRLEWARPARAAYEATLARIAEEDIHTAALVEARVARTMALLQTHPELGTPSVLTGQRCNSIANTGHNLSYRVTRDAIMVVRWYPSFGTFCNH